MKILHAAAEAYPLIKTGGLADVVYALTHAEKKLGEEVRLLLPGYPSVIAGLGRLETLCELGCVMGVPRVRVLKGAFPISGVPTYVISAPSLYARPGNPYQGPGGDWPDNHKRFALLSWCAARIASGEIDFDFVPDIVHTHDWHTGLTSVFMAEIPGIRAKTVHTVHNLAYRGLFPMGAVPDLGLSSLTNFSAQFEFWGQSSFLKAGIVFSDRVTTVSPTYAKETLGEEKGCGLNGVLAQKGAAYSGILNGLDYDIWDPKKDKAIAKTYSAQRLSGKKACRAALRKEFSLEESGMPVYAVVSRLADQKGLDLVLQSIPFILESGAQLVVLGSGDKGLEGSFLKAFLEHPGRIAGFVGFDEAMSHRVLAGADVILVPSRFEPCGLTQMMGLKYGTLPLVRQTGGLADTVSPIAGPAGDGFVFGDASAWALCETMRYVHSVWRDEKAWRAAMVRAMGKDFSWKNAASSYLALYKDALRG